jgi:hypothetical protein
MSSEITPVELFVTLIQEDLPQMSLFIEALVFHELFHRYKIPQKQIARLVKKSNTYVSDRIALRHAEGAFVTAYAHNRINYSSLVEAQRRYRRFQGSQETLLERIMHAHYGRKTKDDEDMINRRKGQKRPEESSKEDDFLQNQHVSEAMADTPHTESIAPPHATTDAFVENVFADDKMLLFVEQAVKAVLQKMFRESM